MRWLLLAAAISTFSDPRPVEIRGWDGDAMEPFVSRDGRWLFFNNRNDPAIDTNLFYAERVDDLVFDFRGEVRGANSAALDAVPTVDQAGTLYFVSTRSYSQTLVTIYRGKLEDGGLLDVEPVAGVAKEKPGDIVFDVEVSADGETLVFADGVFRGGPLPVAADLAIARRRGDGSFERLPRSDEILRRVNTADLEYAAAISADGRELFFTRMGSRRPAIHRATRDSPDAAFGEAERIGSIEGYAEAPSLSADGRSLYYHRRDGERFVIYRVTRPRPGAPH
jgi:hypothetical protein